eukprot:1160439-Pelagomonas_calceolata.AAC.2
MDVIPVVASVLLNAFSCPCSLQHKVLAKAAKERCTKPLNWVLVRSMRRRPTLPKNSRHP